MTAMVFEAKNCRTLRAPVTKKNANSMMPAGTLIHYECRQHPLAAEARTTSGSPSIDIVFKLYDRDSYINFNSRYAKTRT
jgi:hypothetical protein